MSDHNLLKEILYVSEKAANIARICRQDRHLLRLLTQEKGEEEKNKRFDADFKTLADVLIQEVVKYHLAAKFPVLQDNIHGEESNVFTNATGESIVVNISSDPSSTRAALGSILNRDTIAAERLVEAVYSEPQLGLSVEELDQLPQIGVMEDEYGVWIDPIDSTAEYINGNLSCALVLIGVFNKADGTPVLGVVNQPFYENRMSEDGEVSSWRGRVFWGVCGGGIRQHSSLPWQEFRRDTLKIAISSSENAAIRDCLEANGYEIIPLPGAGYKVLSVILNQCDLYICSKPSTYLWDTLAGHAILQSLDTGKVEDRNSSTAVEENGGGKAAREIGASSEGVEGKEGRVGGIVECRLPVRELKYDRLEDKCNKNGIVGFRDVKVAERVLIQIEHLLQR